MSLAYDTKLLRRVWLHQQPIGTPDTGQPDRNLSRTSRLRWLGARRSDSECWDCYEGPSGEPFRASVTQSLDWDVACNVLRELAVELQRACQDESFPTELSLDRLWITDDSHIKLLPFDAPKQHVPDHESPAQKSPDNGTSDNGDVIRVRSDTESAESTKRRKAAGLELLRQAAQKILAATSLGSPSQSSMPLSGREHLQRLAQAVSWDQVNQELQNLQRSPAVNVSRRVAGLLVTTFALPVFFMASVSVAGILIRRQAESMPEVRELGKVAFLLSDELQANRADKQQRVEALEQLVAGKYRDVIEDQELMNSLIAMVSVPVNFRKPLNDALKRQHPSAEELSNAERTVEEIRANHKGFIPELTAIMTPNFSLLMSAFAWLEAVWLPSLVTAVLFRGGLLLRIFGLTLVNRRGQPASRLRFLMRMILTGIPILAIVVVSALSLGPVFISGPTQSWLMQILPFLLVAVICVLAFVFGTRQHLLSDRLAGTVIVARVG